MKNLFSIGISAAVCAVAGAGTLSVSLAAGNLAASAEFEVIGTDLEVRLTNTSAFDVMIPADVLTAVFWDIGGAPLGLTRTSAVLGAGSVVHFGTPDPGDVVGGEFAYREDVAGPHGASYGISASGFSLFGPGDRFPGSDLDPPASPDGLNFGLVPAADNVGTGNSPVTGDVPLIQDQVVFRLSGVPMGFDPEAMITNVNFQYGTDLSEPNLPEPGALGLLLLGGAALVARRRSA